MPLSRLIYISEPQFDAAEGSTLTQLASIMTASRRNNKASNITGALVYDQYWFLQVLEGERRAIWERFSRINEDERHGGCLLIEMADVEDRLFGNWWMGLAARNTTTEPVFAPYLVNGALQADAMSAYAILGLMTELSRVGLSREMHSAA